MPALWRRASAVLGAGSSESTPRKRVEGAAFDTEPNASSSATQFGHHEAKKFTTTGSVACPVKDTRPTPPSRARSNEGARSPAWSAEGGEATGHERFSWCVADT